MRKPFTPVIVTLAAILFLSGCGARSRRRRYDNSSEMNELIAFFFDESQE